MQVQTSFEWTHRLCIYIIEEYWTKKWIHLDRSESRHNNVIRKTRQTNPNQKKTKNPHNLILVKTVTPSI